VFEQRAIPSPARPLFQAAVANVAVHSQAKVNTGNETHGPLLLISGKQDHTVPDVAPRSTLKQYRDSAAVTELKQFEGRVPRTRTNHFRETDHSPQRLVWWIWENV
jgi:alpha-beta hydrolase superfamily lysophospholipase